MGFRPAEIGVVIVDPMHPPRKKSSLVKKRMRLLRQLVGADSDALELMQAALGSAGKRVVLKWPLRADALEGLSKPCHQIIGKTTPKARIIFEDGADEKSHEISGPITLEKPIAMVNSPILMRITE